MPRCGLNFWRQTQVSSTTMKMRLHQRRKSRAAVFGGLLARWPRKRGVHPEGGCCVQLVMGLTPREPRTRSCSQRVNAPSPDTKARARDSCPRHNPVPNTNCSLRPSCEQWRDMGVNPLSLRPYSQVSAPCAGLLWPVLSGIRTTDHED